MSQNQIAEGQRLAQDFKSGEIRPTVAAISETKVSGAQRTAAVATQEGPAISWREVDSIYNLEALIRVLYEGRDETFGNGRLARNLFETAINKQASRVVAEPQVDEQTLSAIEPPDIPDLSEVSHA